MGSGPKPTPVPSSGSRGRPGAPYTSGLVEAGAGTFPAFLSPVGTPAEPLAGAGGRANPLVCRETKTLGGFASIVSYAFFFGSKKTNFTGGN